MNSRRFLIIGLILLNLVAGSAMAVMVQQRKTKKITRVKRPVFSERDWDGIYFENLFDDGLVGDRPFGVVPNGDGRLTVPEIADNEDITASENSFAWSELIGRSTIEDEVKALQTNLSTDITTPTRFKSDYSKVNQSFSVLSMMFAIIREYDAEVRWQEAAGEAQASLERAAANSRVGTSQAYESCKRRALSLQEMVRGSKFVAEEKAPDELDWGTVVDRSPLMDRLQVAMNQLKKLTANKGEFTREKQTVNHESEMVTAIAAVLARENMSDADDSGYLAFAEELQRSAKKAAAATKVDDFEGVSQAVNSISQACDNCHAEWQ